MFYNLLTAPQTVSNTYAQVAWAQPCANHVQHIERLSRASVMLHATWYEGTAQILSLTELKSHLFELYFIGWTIKPMYTLPTALSWQFMNFIGHSFQYLSPKCQHTKEKNNVCQIPYPGNSEYILHPNYGVSGCLDTLTHP